MIFGGVKVDEIPPERTSVVTVLLGRELVKDGHTVSCSKTVFVLQIPGDVFW